MSNQPSTHESYTRDETVKGPSNRSFAYTFAALFAAIGIVPVFFGHGWRLWALAACALLLAIGLWRAHWLAPFNRAWLKLGLVLHRLVSPVVLGFVFFLVLTPTAFLVRLAGKDLLRLKRESGAASQQAYDQAKADMEQTRAALDGARKRLADMKKRNLSPDDQRSEVIRAYRDAKSRG